MKVKGFKEYVQVQEKRIAQLKKVEKRAPVDAAKYMVTMVRKLAPHDTGRLRSGIQRKGSSVIVRASNPENGFPYVHWINQTPYTPYQVLQAGRYKDRYGTPLVKINDDWVKVPGGLMIYGQSPNWRWTGTAGFVEISKRATAQYYKGAVGRYTRKAINLQFE